MNEYDFKKIEAKWQMIWEKENYGKSDDFSEIPKHYHLVEFPYPSGEGLHVGHCMGYGASDAYCRMKRLQGFNVMYPIGWDAFGLPTENYAIKNKIKPADATAKNTDNFRKQMKALGYSFDWSREINTTDPNYYKWTQWIFLQFYKHAYINNKLIEVSDDDTKTPRMAFQAEIPVNWCPSCKINLANEEVIANSCERCGTVVEKRNQKQWMLRITAYADRLIDDLSSVDFPDQVKQQQINWIGRSTGSNIIFPIKDSDLNIDVFTTRADTLFGCTYVVLSPEHPLVKKLKVKSKNEKEIDDYINTSQNKSEIDRTDISKEKTGVRIEGIKAINPINDDMLDIWIADYVLANYGTGAVMAVPAHDERDWEFSKKYKIPIKQVIAPDVTYFKTPPVEGKPWVERTVIEAVVYNPKTDKYLILKWKNQPWSTFITGGIDKDEDIIMAARREIFEETGYKNVKLIKNLGITRPRFFAAHKDENRRAIFHGLLFELENDDKDETDQKEKDIHDIIWLDRKDLKIDDIVCASFDYWMAGIDNKESAYIDYGILINSDKFNGLNSEDAKKKITEKLKEKGHGNFSINYKLRDWIFSRQHYWGEPIPIIHCPKDGVVPLDEKDLPLKLPDVEKYQPTDTGQSPLAAITDWVNVKCPKCGGEAKRETDTMPNWAGSSWYYLRYCDPENNIKLADKDKLEYWTPIDIYNGGTEHITLHLLYSRFWHKFLYDLNAVPTTEPYQKRITHGIILGPDNQKMSKSKGNIINPDEMVDKFGADTLRAYIMFIGPYNQESAWSMAGIQGVHRFLKRVWQNSNKVSDTNDTTEILVKLHQTIKGITNDLESFQMNTVISKLMELNNAFDKVKTISKNSFRIFLQLLFPTCPHISSELYQLIDDKETIDNIKWPKPDNKYLITDKTTIAIQINGKLKDTLMIDVNAKQDEVEKAALEKDKIKNIIRNQNIKNTIYISGRIINFVV